MSCRTRGSKKSGGIIYYCYECSNGIIQNNIIKCSANCDRRLCISCIENVETRIIRSVNPLKSKHDFYCNKDCLETVIKHF